MGTLDLFSHCNTICKKNPPHHNQHRHHHHMADTQIFLKMYFQPVYHHRNNDHHQMAGPQDLLRRFNTICKNNEHHNTILTTRWLVPKGVSAKLPVPEILAW